MRYLLDLPDAEIADILRISPAGVRSQAHRGLRTLRGEADTTGSPVPGPGSQNEDEDEPASSRKRP